MCEQNICGNVEFEATASMPGVYKLITHFLGVRLVIEQEFETDADLIFPLSGLNENYEYTVEIIDPLGDKVIITKDDIEYDCFKFKTVIEKVLVQIEIESS